MYKSKRHVWGSTRGIGEVREGKEANRVYSCMKFSNSKSKETENKKENLKDQVW